MFKNYFYKLSLGLLLFNTSLTTNSFSQTVYGISNHNLISFNAATPGTLLSSVTYTGITDGQAICGLDFRPLTGELYALGYESTTGASQLYTVNLSTGVLTAINTVPVMLPTNMGRVAFDFNPTVDRIRVTGSNDVNLRLNPLTGAIAASDVNLAYATGDVNEATNPTVGTVAYTNSYIGATATTLYDYDELLNVLATQNPPNNGTLNTIGSSGLSVNVTNPLCDMDIYFDFATGTNKAYFTANLGTDNTNNFYTINPTTGATTLVGQIGTGIPVKEIAVFIDRTVPALIGQLIYAIASNNNLLSFDSENPGIIRASVPITGITANQIIAGSDFRPETGELYALGYNSTTKESQLYVINTTTGVATVINSTPTTLELGTGDIGMDFNPTVDRIRVVAANNANYRLIPTSGLVAAQDINLAYAVGDVNEGKDPAIGACAYTNSFKGSTMTTLFDYDDTLNVLASQLPPNNGTLNTIASTGIVVNRAEPSVDIDIYYNSNDMSNTAYLNANTGGSLFDSLYVLNTTNGNLTLKGRIGGGISIKDIAIVIDALPTSLIPTNNSDLQTLNVFPNPNSGKFNIRYNLEQSSAIKVRVSDVMGKNAQLILEDDGVSGQNESQITTGSLAKGIYVIELLINDVVSQRAKFVIE